MVRYAAGAETRRKLVPRFVEGETRPPLLPQCRLPDFFKAVMYGLLEFGFGVGKRRCDPGVSSHCDRNVLNAAAVIGISLLHSASWSPGYVPGDFSKIHLRLPHRR